MRSETYLSFFYISTWFWHVNLEWKILARLSKDRSQGEEVLLGKCGVGKGGDGTCQHSPQRASSLPSYIPVSKWPQTSEQRVRRRACCIGRNSIQALKELDVGPNSAIFHLLCKLEVKSLCIYLMGKPEMYNICLSHYLTQPPSPSLYGKLDIWLS